MTRMLRLLFASLLALAFAPSLFAQSLADQIGLTALRDRLGAAAPTGAGISVMQAEALGAAPPPYLYLADNSNPEINGRVIDRSGGGGVSGHAQSVAVVGFGRFTGVAPNVSEINGFKVDGSLDAGDWLGSIYINFGAGAPVAMANMRVQNHSWIATGAFDAEIQEIHRRYDFALRRDNVVAAVGVNNGGGSPIPPLLGNSYNAIAVGNTNGSSSFGPSIGDVPGRSKPDIVAPLGATSFSTPVVAASAALMLQTADQLGNPNRGRMETIKAVLLAGATKDEFGGGWTRTNNGSYLEPLDRRFGAGEVNVNNSHLALSVPEQNGTDLALDAAFGWDFETMVGAGAVRRYYFDIPSNLASVQFSAAATWLRRITPMGTGANLFETSDATLSLVELRLFNANADFSLGSLIDSSVSPIDNVQYLYQPNLLGNRRYALEVTLAGLPAGQSSEDVAIAWFSTVPVPEPATFILTGLAGAGALAAARKRRRKASAGPKSLAA